MKLLRTYNYKKMLLIGSAILLLLWTAVLCAKENTDRELVINEVCSNNYSIATDENQTYSDYIELYNGGFFNCSLDGYTISDGKNVMSLDGRNVPAKGYCIVNDLTFGISAAGENISLFNPEGQCIDVVAVPSLEQDTVYSR